MLELLKRFQTLVLMCGVVLIGSNAFILSPILTEVSLSLDTTPLQVAWAISSFGAATAVSALFLAPFSDTHSKRWTLTGAGLLLGAAQLICLFSVHWVMLCFGQAVAGLAVGVLLPSIYSTAMATAEKGREAARLGFILTGWALSLVAAVPISAAITEVIGWRPVYATLAGLCVVVSLGFYLVIPAELPRSIKRTNPMAAFRLPGVAFLLLIVLGYMTAFYGCYAFFGEGIRNTLKIGAGAAGIYVLAYGAGFGLAGLFIAKAPPRLGRGFLTLVFSAISLNYFAWIFAVHDYYAAFVVTFLWGFLNQFGVNSLIVLLNQKAAEARGAVLGLNSAVTYTSVFAGPFFLGPIFQTSGFVPVAIISGLAVSGSAVALFFGGKRLFAAA